MGVDEFVIKYESSPTPYIPHPTTHTHTHTVIYVLKNTINW